MSADVESMFSVREVPWHRVGTIVPEALTAKEALVAGTVGSRYKPVQNSEAFSFFDTLVDSGDAKYETAGSLAGGRRVFLTATMPREILIGGEKSEEHRIYLVLATSHDGSLAFTAAVTPVRVVCQNTLNMALKGAKQAWSMRHVDSIDGKIEEARRTLGMTFEYVDAYEAEMNKLVAEEFTKRQFEQLVKDVFPDPANKDGRFSADQYSMIGVLEASPTIGDAIRFTKYGALQAMTEWSDWGKAVRSSKTSTEGETRLQNVWFGNAPKDKTKFHAALASA